MASSPYIDEPSSVLRERLKSASSGAASRQSLGKVFTPNCAASVLASSLRTTDMAVGVTYWALINGCVCATWAPFLVVKHGRAGARGSSCGSWSAGESEASAQAACDALDACRKLSTELRGSQRV